VIELDLARGPFLVPVLVRAVRAGGVQAGLDVGRLAAASSGAEVVARSWAAGDAADPLSVRIDDGAATLAVDFGMADADAARAARALAGDGARAVAPGVVAEVRGRRPDAPGGLRLTVG
jgi:hypothetical protein